LELSLKQPVESSNLRVKTGSIPAIIGQDEWRTKQKIGR
jgi:hypothetical protein